MSNDTKTAIEVLQKKAKDAEKSEDALRFSQAAVNLANCDLTIVNTNSSK